MTLQDIAQQMCRMKECEEFPLKWKTDVERMIHALNFAEDYYKYFGDLTIDYSELISQKNNIIHVTPTGFVCMDIGTLKKMLSLEDEDMQKIREGLDKTHKDINELNNR